MKYVSTRKGFEATSAETVFQGLAPDGGLYVPSKVEKVAGIEKVTTLREAEELVMNALFDDLPAEVRAAAVLGGDAVGMSTVYEATAANHCGIRTLGISLMANMAAGILKQKLSGEEVNAAAERARKDFTALIRACLAELKKQFEV